MKQAHEYHYHREADYGTSTAGDEIQERTYRSKPAECQRRRHQNDDDDDDDEDDDDDDDDDEEKESCTEKKKANTKSTRTENGDDDNDAEKKRRNDTAMKHAVERDKCRRSTESSFALRHSGLILMVIVLLAR